MKNLLLHPVLVVFCARLPSVSNAQCVQTNGPFGGPILALAVSGTVLFAGTYAGVFLSTNSGTSWSAPSTGLTNTAVLSHLYSIRCECKIC